MHPKHGRSSKTLHVWIWTCRDIKESGADEEEVDQESVVMVGEDVEV